MDENVQNDLLLLLEAVKLRIKKLVATIKKNVVDFVQLPIYNYFCCLHVLVFVNCETREQPNANLLLKITSINTSPVLLFTEPLQFSLILIDALKNHFLSFLWNILDNLSKHLNSLIFTHRYACYA